MRKITCLLLVTNLIHAQDILFPGKTDTNNIKSENETSNNVLIEEIFNEDFGEPVFTTRYCNCMNSLYCPL